VSTAYAYGGGACARAWFTAISARAMVVDIVDTGNATGLVECSRIVTGPFWSPVYNVDVGAQLAWLDTSRHVRSDAGDLLTDTGPRMRKLTFSMAYMPVGDRLAATTLLRANGMGTPVFISIFPANADLDLERDYQLYGKLSAISAMTLTTMSMFNLPLDFEEL
jgi:hypothetical protein